MKSEFVACESLEDAAANLTHNAERIFALSSLILPLKLPFGSYLNELPEYGAHADQTFSES